MGTFLPPYLWAMLAAIELADQVQVQGATGAAQRSAESCPAPSCRAVSMRWLPLSSRRPEWAGAEHGMRLQRPAILRTTDKPPHIAVEQLDPVGELGQVRALLQIQIELDPQHIHPVPVNVPPGQGSLWSHPIWVRLVRLAAQLDPCRTSTLARCGPSASPSPNADMAGQVHALRPACASRLAAMTGSEVRSGLWLLKFGR